MIQSRQPQLFAMPAAPPHGSDITGLDSLHEVAVVRSDVGTLRRRDVMRWAEALGCTVAALAVPGRGRADAPRPTPSFPLRAAPEGHYLVDQRGQPFFILGDSPQAIYARVTLAEADSYLAARQAQGFNTLLADPTFTNANDGFVRPAANGHLPFLRNLRGNTYDGASGTADFSTPDPAYWDYVDTVLAHAQDHGFLVLQYVLAWGYGGKSMWLDLINPRNTAAVCYSFGEFLGRRFRGRANIIWIDGSDSNGDETPRAPDGTSGIARALAVTRGMRAAGAMQLRTGDWMADSLSTDQTPFAPFMSVNGIYAYGDKIGYNATYYQARRAYLRTPAVPAFLKETGYEAEHMIPGDPASVLKYEWWCLLSGATAGVVYGHGDLWRFAAGRWRAAVEAPGGQDMQRMGALMRSLAWYALVPSELAGMRRLVLSPNGQAQPPIPDYVAAAQTPDGDVLLAYVPPFGKRQQHLTLDLRSMRGATQAQWWDPTSARMQEAGRYPAGATPTLITPGRNSGGANDWVVVVQAAA